MESANKMKLKYTNVNGYLLPDLTYVNCVSGALVYNHATKETIYSRTLSVDTVKKKADPGSGTRCQTCRC